MSEQKSRTCVGCGTVGFKWFIQRTGGPLVRGWWCADCHGLYKNRPAASREEMEATLAALRDVYHTETPGP